MKASSEVVDEAIVQNFTKLQDLLANASIFMLDDLRIDISHNVGTATIPMEGQHMMEDVLKELQNHLNMNLLYAYRTLDGRRHKLVIYSMPYEDEMYIINMESQQYGIVEEMTVTLFESLDTMLSWLRSCLTPDEGVIRHIETIVLEIIALETPKRHRRTQPLHQAQGFTCLFRVRFSHGLGEKFRSVSVHLEHLLLFPFRFALRCLVIPSASFNVYTSFMRKGFQRFREGHPINFHVKFKDVARSMASETMKEAFFFINVK